MKPDFINEFNSKTRGNDEKGLLQQTDSCTLVVFSCF